MSSLNSTIKCSQVLIVMAAMISNMTLRDYMLEEFKRRHALTTLRKELQDNMPEKYVNMWWCRDEALREIRRQFVSSTNHCVIDSFLGSEAAQSVDEEVRQANESQLLVTEGMLSFQGRNTSVRTDVLGYDVYVSLTCVLIMFCVAYKSCRWFDCTAPPSGETKACFFDSQSDPESKWPWLRYLLQRIETIVTELGSVEGVTLSADDTTANHVANDIIGTDFKKCTSRSRVMVTKYEGRDDDSSHYEKHLDNGNRNGRKVTAIYYTNKGWRRADGGALRLYLRNHCRRVRRDGDVVDKEDIEGEPIEIYCDVEPIEDRLVLFMSDARTPHEVLPTHKDRFAITVWFWDPVEKAESEDRKAMSDPPS